MPRIIPEESSSGGGGGGISSSQSTFVYRPGGLSSGNVYASWENLYNDLVTVPGPKIVQINDSLVSPAIIPSGFYNLDDVKIVGDQSLRDSHSKLQLDNGVVFTDVEEFNYIELIGNSNSESLDIAIANQVIFRDSLVTVNSGKSPIFKSSSTFDLVLDRTTLGGSEQIIDVISGTTTIWLENQSTILSDVIQSAVLSIVDFKCVDSNVLVLSQPNILGTTSSSNLSESEKIYYDNTISGLTSENVQDAIDELSFIGGGNVIGPGPTVTENGIVTWDGTGGFTVKDSGIRHYGKLASSPISPAPSDGDLYYDTTLSLQMEYNSARAKWLSTESTTFYFGRNNVVATGQYYRGIDGRVLSDSLGFYSFYNGTVIGLGYTRSDSDSATFEIVSNGSVIDSLLSSSLSGGSLSLDGDFSSGEILAIRNSSIGNATTNVQGWIKIKWRS